MLPIGALLGGAALRAVAPAIGRVVGTQFAKMTARPATSVLSAAAKRPVSEKVAQRFTAVKAGDSVSSTVSSYGSGMMLGASMGRSRQEFNNGAFPSTEEKQSLV